MELANRRCQPFVQGEAGRENGDHRKVPWRPICSDLVDHNRTNALPRLTHFCPNCWEEIPPGTETCPACGYDLREPNTTYVEKLLSSLSHPERTRVGLAIDILANRLHEPAAVEPLIRLLMVAADFGIQSQAAHGLGELRDPRAVEPLGQVLMDDKTALLVRIEAAMSLSKLGSDKAIDFLQRASHSPQTSVATASTEALETLAQHDPAPLPHRDLDSREDES